MDYKDYYKILGVSKDASDKDIKKAYRKLAREYHPDTNPDNKAAEEQFKEINEAHEVLSDADKRRQYDQFGAQWKNYARGGGNMDDFYRQWSGGRPGGGSHTRTVSPEEFQDLFGGGVGGFSDFFETLFAGGVRQGSGFDSFGTRTAGYARPTRGRDIEQSVDIKLEEAHQGTTRILQQDGERLEVSIPRGVKTGSKVRVAGKGAPGTANGPRGDFYLVVQVNKHARFTREGDNLRVKAPVDIYTLVLGGEAAIPTLDRQIMLTIPAGTPNGKVFRLKGLGMPNLRQPDQLGDLYAEMDVQLPGKISDKEEDLFRQLQALQQ